MKAFGTFLGMAVGLALLAGILAGGYLLFQYVLDVFATLEPAVATLAAIASVVALLCAIIVAGGLKACGQQAQTTGGRLEKAHLYEHLLLVCGEQLNGKKSTTELAADNKLIGLRRSLTLHGSPKVIAAYVKLQRQVRQDGEEDDEVPALLHKLVAAMREDLGQAALMPTRSDLLDLWLGRY